MNINASPWARLKAAFYHTFRKAGVDEDEQAIRILIGGVEYAVYCYEQGEQYYYRLWKYFDDDLLERIFVEEQQNPYAFVQAVHERAVEALQQMAFLYTGKDISSLVYVLPSRITRQQKPPKWNLSESDAYMLAADLLDVEEDWLRTLPDREIVTRLEWTDDFVQKFFQTRLIDARMSRSEI